MNKVFFAILLKASAVFFIVSMDVIIKKLSLNFPTFQIVFFRCLFGLIPVTLMLFITNSKLKTKKLNIHILRAVIASIVMFAFFKAISVLPLADVSSISFASVMLTVFMPEGIEFNLIVRVLIVTAFFSGAYFAENIRGGLQSL